MAHHAQARCASRASSCAHMLLIAALACAWAPARQAAAAAASTQQSTVAPSSAITVTVDLAARSDVSPLLYGVFFEEINHAGEGGLYAELVQDRSFESAAYAATQTGVIGVTRYLHTWLPLANTYWSLATASPVYPTNPTFARLTVSAVGATGGMTNQGYWGIPVTTGQRYYASLYARVFTGSIGAVTLQLASSNGATIYASTTFKLTNTLRGWEQVQGYLVAAAGVDDPSAILAVTFVGAGTLDIDVVSVFPAANYPPAQNPFRADLLSALQDLQPKFLRFPGGVYVEGTTLANAWQWKTSLDGAETRPGHLNAKWQYWSTDGLGLYEYLLLSEALGASPIWVVNAGIARQNGVTGNALNVWIQDALDGIEFATGAVTSTWGAVRSRMGHPAPFVMTHLGIGNENCGMTYYTENYAIFYAAIKAVYPALILIANCNDLKSQVQMYDYHNYMYNADNFYDQRDFFQASTYTNGPPIFVSEYATRDGNGDLRGALAESAFMMGMEAMNGKVAMAAYAPMLSNVNDKDWAPCFIYHNTQGIVMTPSYWVQLLFAQNTGEAFFATSTTTGDTRAPVMVMASSTCTDVTCTKVAIKLVNYDNLPKQITLNLVDLPGTLQPTASLITLTSAGGADQNDFGQPTLVTPSTTEIAVAATTILPMVPWSLCILILDVAGLAPSR